jgi:hypothetical protein
MLASRRAPHKDGSSVARRKTMRRWAWACLFFGAAACSVETGGEGASVNVETGASGGYMLDVRADETARAYIVTSPDGKSVAGEVRDGASALVEQGRIAALLGPPPTPGDDPKVAIKAPGFSLNIDGNERAGGRVAIDVGGKTVVDVTGSGDGDAAHARVHIAGVDANAAKDFIEDADKLSPEVKAQMMAELGLQ